MRAPVHGRAGPRTPARVLPAHDGLYELEAAIEDVDRDLAAADPEAVDDYREALDWLLQTARPLTRLRFGESGA